MNTNLWLQLWLHVLGDYVTQSHWMAVNKTSRMSVALLHATVYSLPFALMLRPSWQAYTVMCLTHAVIDRYRLVKYVIFLKNALLSPWFAGDLFWSDFYINDVELGTRHTVKGCSATGFPADTPPFLSCWLNVIVDNWMHITINALALWYL
jgi:hypothetical protein